MGCQIPILDGFETTRQLRRTNIRSVPIIALTASAMSANYEDFLRSGMDDYLSKHVMLDHLPAAPSTAHQDESQD